MSKRVKSLLEKDFGNRFKDLDAVAVINPRGINANKNNAVRRKLHAQGLRMTVVKNNLARRATAQSKLKGFDVLLDGPSAVVYGKASIATIARLLLDEKKADDKLELRGVFFDGEVYTGVEGVTKISKMPTREEAIALVIGAILSPGKKLAGALKGPGSKLGAILKTIEEKAKEKEGAAPAAESAPASA
jgi:large subunit ribosomal protein L10